MIRQVKKGMAAETAADADRKVRQTVEAMLADVAERGDAAVRELSEKFDKWSPASFRLSREEVDGIVASVPASVIEDIRFAQAQIRRFAEHQRARSSTSRSRRSPASSSAIATSLSTASAATFLAADIPWSPRRI